MNTHARPTLIALYLVPGLLIVGALPSVSQTQKERGDQGPKRDIRIAENAKANIGYGWSISSESSTGNKCIEWDKESVTPATAQSTNNDIRQITDHSDLMQALNVTASVQLNSILSHADAKASYANRFQSTYDSIYFSALATVHNPPSFVEARGSTPVQLTPMAVKLAKGDMARFLTVCGDSYVYSRTTGAELYALVRITDSSALRLEKIAASVTGGYRGVAMSGDIHATLDKLSKEVTEQSIFDIKYQQTGGKGDPLPVTLNGVKEQIQKLKLFAEQNGFPLEVQVRSYEQLYNWPSGKALKWLTTDYGNISRQYGRMLSLWETTNDMLKRADGVLILNHGVSTNDLVKLNSKLHDHVKSLAASAAECMETNGRHCAVRRNDNVPDYEYRVQLPVAYGSFEDSEISNAYEYWQAKRRLIGPARERVKAYQKQNPWVDQSPEFVERDAVVRDTIDAAIIDEAKLHKLYESPGKLREAVKQQWIMAPRNARCSADKTGKDPGCIDVNEVEQYAKLIKVK